MTREIWHGTWNGYGNHKCRCVDCRVAASVYMRRYLDDPEYRKRKRAYVKALRAGRKATT